MTNRSAANNNEVISTVSGTTADTDQPDHQPEHFVNRSVPVLFPSRRGLQLRRFHSVLSTGQASYTIQFCDLERWSNHFKLSSVGLTADSSTAESTKVGRISTKNVKFVRQSPDYHHHRWNQDNG